MTTNQYIDGFLSLDEATKDWERDGIWKIAPAGLNWIKAGARASIGKGARIGEGASIGARASIGEGASIGARASIGEGARIGEWASIGARASIDARASIGEGARIGARSSGAVDLGWADGYRKCIAEVGGVAYIGAGCRWFTLADAIAHWSGKADRDLTNCLMQSAIAVAMFHGWSFGDES